MNPKISEYIDDIKDFQPEKAKILLALRKIILKKDPEIFEVIMYGGLVYKTNKLLWGLFVRKIHVTLEFGEGSKMDDPYSVLEGKGKEGRRHIKLLTYDDIEIKKVKHYIDKSYHQ